MCRKQLKIFLNNYEKIPYKVMNIIGADVNYGGRVTDDKDQILIKTILKQYICAPVVEDDNYKFSTSGLYYSPNAETQEEFRNYI